MTPRSSTTPQPTPLRQSTRIVTPSRSHPNYVRTSRDSQRQAVIQSSQEVPSNNHSESEAESVTQTRTNQLCRKKRKQKRPAAKRKKTKTVIVTDNNSEAADDIVDFVQDSDDENAKVKKSQTEKISPLDNVRDYFEPPFHANEADKPGPNAVLDGRVVSCRQLRASASPRSTTDNSLALCVPWAHHLAVLGTRQRQCHQWDNRRIWDVFLLPQMLQASWV
ncbi:hypothetical protein PCANC_23423 [Puccinia coronata f. sp. avenae]|uniref:Uncharacterized protein n=1 Tax=Puccinia coronata f. sp. avenae TaxID=200324 RepID=A0A2N5TVV4_9BASI|nr:hypothetical protein PCANC_23423 [Puccinia coronata f. sp. avenae]